MTAQRVAAFDLLIDGRFVPAASGETFAVANPSTNETIAQVAKAAQADVDAAVSAARRAFEGGPWPAMTGLERQRLMMRLAQLLRDNLEELAVMETSACGKPVAESRGDVANAALTLEYYAGMAPRVTGETLPIQPDLLDYTLREPLGVCACIVPWNFPLVIALWKVAPALATGNTVVLKPASYTPTTAIRLGELALAAGFPPGVLNVIAGPGSIIGRALAEHPDVDKISFTGETETGREIQALAAGTLKKLSLELGGKSPNIVFPDADIESAVNGSLLAIYGNAGQRCTARSRLLLHEGAREEFLDRFVDKANRIRIGDPLLTETQMGPLVSRGQVERVSTFIGAAEREGARVVAGGRRPDDPALARGNFYRPTVVDRVRPEMQLAQEEVFGPVLAVLPFEAEERVIELANSVQYGLAATIWTRDIARAHRVARRLRAGNISINYPTVNLVGAPFGGYKQSGMGREMGPHAIESYTQIKNVVVNLSDASPDWFKL
ncbi:MAG: aldehyde dehydrogenase [Chloroflexi bacterium]|nr:aldehyde dehydrogenase [Chloroflexota bacterium]